MWFPPAAALPPPPAALPVPFIASPRALVETGTSDVNLARSGSCPNVTRAPPTGEITPPLLAGDPLPDRPGDPRPDRPGELRLDRPGDPPFFDIDPQPCLDCSFPFSLSFPFILPEARESDLDPGIGDARGLVLTLTHGTGDDDAVLTGEPDNTCSISSPRPEGDPIRLRRQPSALSTRLRRQDAWPRLLVFVSRRRGGVLVSLLAMAMGEEGIWSGSGSVGVVSTPSTIVSSPGASASRSARAAIILGPPAAAKSTLAR